MKIPRVKFYNVMIIVILSITLRTIRTVYGQVPAFGGCPDYQPMNDFNMTAFLGKWYEIERLFTVTELASKCISANYERRIDGQIWVDNLITNRFTGVQRKISGTVKLTNRNGEAKYTVKYNSLPINYDTNLMVLDTDYKTFAVIYSCSPIGPIGHTQSVWVMTRERIPPGPVLQRAYGILDKHKFTRTFFIKTNQLDCEILPPPIEAIDPTSEQPSSQNRKIQKKKRN